MNTHKLNKCLTVSGVEYFTKDGVGERFVVFVHGWRDSAIGWNWVIENLPVTTFKKIIAVQRHAVALDTTDSAALLDRYATQVVEAIADAVGMDSQVILVGQSMGAAVAELSAVQLAGRLLGLVLITPAPLAGTPLPLDVRTEFEDGARDLDRVNTGLMRVPLAVETSAQTQLRMIVATPQETEHSTLQTLASWIGGHPAGGKTSKVIAPTLIVATDDQVFPEAMLRENVVPRFSDVDIKVVHGMGHFPHLERPDLVAGTVSEFIVQL